MQLVCFKKERHNTPSKATKAQSTDKTATSTLPRKLSFAM
jgi:hypothetical protein